MIGDFARIGVITGIRAGYRRIPAVFARRTKGYTQWAPHTRAHNALVAQRYRRDRRYHRDWSSLSPGLVIGSRIYHRDCSLCFPVDSEQPITGIGDSLSPGLVTQRSCCSATTARVMWRSPSKRALSMVGANKENTLDSEKIQNSPCDGNPAASNSPAMQGRLRKRNQGHPDSPFLPGGILLSQH